MRAAPAVEAALDAGGVERMLITLMYALAGATVSAWGLAHAELAWWPFRLLAALSAALLAAVPGRLLAQCVLPRTAQRLRWNGQRWSLLGAGPGGPVDPSAETPLASTTLALDLGGWVLLRLHPAGPGADAWRVASAHGAGPAWHGLRLALRAHAGLADPDAVDDPNPRAGP